MILLFLRRFNDIDHSVPIVYKLAKEGYKNISLLAINPNLDISNDFRLNFLKEEFDIKIDYIYKFYKPNIIHKISAFMICDLKVFSSRFLSIFLNFLNFKNYFYNHLFGYQWSIDMIKAKDVKLFAFDWQKPGKFNTLSLIRAAKKTRIPIIAVPHGLDFNINKIWSKTALKKGLKTQDFGERWKDFEKIIVQHEHYKNIVVSCGVPDQKLEVIGSARFCNEWENIYFNILPKADPKYLTKNPHTINIVYMDHSSDFRLNVDEIISTVKSLSEIDYVDLVIKPSTAGKNSMSSKKLYDYAEVDHTTSSVHLIRWSDIVIGNQSSIMLDALILNKVLICPQYFEENSTLFRKRKVSANANNFSEILDIINNVKADSNFLPYNKNDVDSFIVDIVYGGKKDRDVLKDHMDFILTNMK